MKDNPLIVQRDDGRPFAYRRHDLGKEELVLPESGDGSRICLDRGAVGQFNTNFGYV